ncbi:MAG: hypothetical protein EAZ95_02820 [Bacteroidetes bacterium]|nr:MAG: hypothetical protein EAZ95_02820 [Bacteroidota bacterium]
MYKHKDSFFHKKSYAKSYKHSFFVATLHLNICSSCMKLAYSLFFVVLTFALGFLYAGVLGASISGVGYTMAWVVWAKKTRNLLTKMLLSVCILGGISYGLMMMTGLLDAGKAVHEKVQGIKKELVKAGYTLRWFIISQKRYSFFNDMLANSIKNGKSRHLQGKAIDLYVIDINNDGKYDEADFALILQAFQQYEANNPHAKGNIIHYFGKGYFTQHMVHIDVE